jgi:hypothetical protein
MEETGNTAVMITGPTGSRGSETYTTANKVQKGLGFNYIGDSTITDNGTTVSISASLTVTGSINVRSGSFSGSAIDNITDVFTSIPPIDHVITLTQAQYNTISGSADPNTLYYISDASSSVALLNSANTFTANNVFSGSIRGEVNALSISSNTASLNCALDNFFTLQLVSGSNTFINPSNILPGQTINLRVNTTGSATVSFPSSVKQVSGSLYVPTTTTSTDIVTFISFDSSSLFLSNVKNLV